MHIGNVLTASVLAAHDALALEASKVGADLRELSALSLIASHEGCSVEWLRPRVGLTQSGTVRLIDRLEDRGWLTRGRGAGREVALSLTDGGLRVLDDWHAQRDAALNRFLEDLPERSRADLADALTQILASQSRARVEADRTCRTCDWFACGDDCPVDRSVANGR